MFRLIMNLLVGNTTVEVAMKTGYVLLLSMIIGWVLPATASAQGGHQRDSWYIG